MRKQKERYYHTILAALVVSAILVNNSYDNCAGGREGSCDTTNKSGIFFVMSFSPIGVTRLPKESTSNNSITTHKIFSLTPSALSCRRSSLLAASSGTTGSKLSRPERKALERKKKEDRRKNKNAKGGMKGTVNNNARNHTYKLNSQRISILNSNSTAEDVTSAIKRAQNRHDEQDLQTIAGFLLEEVDASYAYGYRGSLLARLAVAALHVSSFELAMKAIEERRLVYRSSMLPMESAAIIRGLLRVHHVNDAIQLLDDELSIPLKGTDLQASESRDRLKHRAAAIASIASRHFFEGEPSMAVKACDMLTEVGPLIREAGLKAEDLTMPWTRIIQGATQCESRRRDGSVVPCLPEVEMPCNLVYSVLNAMTTFPSDNDDLTYEALSNALVRRTVFVTGAVDMNGCPKADRGEAVFVGRSNVGKSSLVNMVTNRKSLAYTSKRPGKTQQFNFFAVNDKPGKEKEIKYGDEVAGEKDLDSFYIVDVPGFGFAKVPEKQRKLWSDFLSDYLKNRSTLRVVFHLIDARHGPLEDDTNIMKQIGTILPNNVKYVVVLTKADKNVKNANTKNAGKVSRTVVEDVRKALKDSNIGKTPLILTSAETKLGRDDIWRFLRLAAES
mmetsp:Transcript_23051/g.32478  ORF Transcript_23051/g.32478 Transcript_23051/m.32478 type:complete len:616 (-) Transcript_23051:322-2169(-)